MALPQTRPIDDVLDQLRPRHRVRRHFRGRVVASEAPPRLRRDSRHWTSETIEKRLDRRLYRLDADQSRPRTWRPEFVRDGIYIQDTATGLHMSLQQASALSLQTCCERICSIVPGRLAVFLNHEWGVCYCAAAGQH